MLIPNEEMLLMEKELKDLIGISDEDAPDFVQELDNCAWNIIKEDPDIDRESWINELIRQYPSEVVDAYGTNPFEVYHKLADLWDKYTDPDVPRDYLNNAYEWIRQLQTVSNALRIRLYSVAAQANLED